MLKINKLSRLGFVFLMGSLMGVLSPLAQADEIAYVGVESCRECHESEYASFMKFANKSKSFESIKKMESKLTAEEYRGCFECHTTGYGKKGGFVSEAQTPELKIAGCEVCHGPGSLHVESGDPEDITRKPDMESCLTCHNSDRVEGFGFKPLMYSGAH